MNGMNKAIMTVVSTIALLYSAFCFGLTLDQYIRTGGEVMKLMLFFPHDGQLGIDISLYTDQVFQYYGMFINRIVELTTLTELSYILGLLLVVTGFILPFFGFMTLVATNCQGKDSNEEYLWTHRPHAFLKCLAMPWDLIPAAFLKFKPLVIIPILLLPLYLPWAIMMMIFLIIPFLLVRICVSSAIGRAAKKEKIGYAKNTGFFVCPHCKMKVERPMVKCKCGLIMNYPVPNKFGYKYHTCIKGHTLPCTCGTRGDLRTICPFCNEMFESREAKPYSISLVGAPGSGKTTLILSATQEITAAARRVDINVDSSPGLSKSKIETKEFTPPTPTGNVDSEYIFLRSLNFNTREIMFNDTSGMEFQTLTDRSIYQEHYKYNNGIIFFFDPISLKRELKKDLPSEIYESFMYKYTNINNLGPGARIKVPFAIVATKSDIMKPVLRDDMVRQYLIDSGQDNFVRSVESNFEDVKYFSVNSVGFDCSNSVNPIWWIIEKYDKEVTDTIRFNTEKTIAPTL